MTYLIVTSDPISTQNAVLEYAKTYNPSDVFWVKKAPDKKEITVDIIATMIDQVNLASVSGKKLFIIFQADLMNASAQNKLLKTLENTDDSTTVLFLCQSLNNILPTIRSRAIVRYHHTDENLTLQQMAANNPDAAQIKVAAHHLFAATTVEQAMSYLPILAKPENLTLSLDALNQALKAANFSVNKKLTIYQTLAKISRNIAANCNPTNTFDWLLLAMF